MFERARSWTGVDLALFGLVLAGAVALSLAWTGPLPHLIAIVDVLALVFHLRVVPRAALAAAERACWALLLLTGFYSLAWSIYPLIPDAVVRAFPRLAGYALAFLSALFLTGRSTWDPARTLVPAALGVLVVAALDPGAPLGFPIVLASVSIVGGIAADKGHGRLARLRRVFVFALAAGGVAAAIIRLLPWAQPFVETAVVRMIEPPAAVSGFSLESRLGEVEELTLSPRVLMHVTTTMPEKLRAAVFVSFDGVQWRAKGPPPQPLLVETGAIGGNLGSWLEAAPGQVFAAPGPLDEAWQAGAVRTRIVQVAPVVGSLPAPVAPLLVRRSGPVIIDAFGVLGPASQSLETYGVVSARPGASRPAPTDTAFEGELVGLPADLDPRFSVLAVRLGRPGSAPAEEQIARTVAFLQDECRYSLKPGRFRTHQPVAEFLFEKKKGYCEYFASAAAILLRLQGLPTRYVRGFTVREANRLGGHFVVREADAHAWVEVRLPGRGWMEVDPTPAGGYEAAHGGIERGGLQSLLSWLGGRWSELRALVAARAGWALVARLGEVARSLVRGRPAVVTVSLALLAAAFVVRRVWPVVRRIREARQARRRAAEPAAPPELAELLARADRLWARHGRRRSLFRAPLEHLASVPEGALPGPVLETSRRAVEAYYRGRYAGHAVTAGEIRELRTALEAAASRRTST